MTQNLERHGLKVSRQKSEYKNRVRLPWNKWRETTAVICDKKVQIKLIVQINQTVIKSTMLYGVECWAVRKKEEHLLNKTDEDASFDPWDSFETP